MLRTDIDTRTIWMYGPIGENEEITAAGVIDHLDKLGPGNVTLRINSEGGEVSEGWAIHGAMDRHDGSITTVNDSVCALMATVIFMAGNHRLATPFCSFMLHSPHTAAAGDQAELRKVADRLDHFEKTMRNAYLQVLNVGESELKEWLESETWLNAAEAVEAGLATDIEDQTTDAKLMLKDSADLRPTAKYLAGLKQEKVLSKFRLHKKKRISKALKQARQFSPEQLAAVGYRAGFLGLNAPMANQMPSATKPRKRQRSPIQATPIDTSNSQRRRAFMNEWHNSDHQIAARAQSNRIAAFLDGRKVEAIKKQMIEKQR